MREVVYHQVAGVDLMATLYLPDGPGPFPSVVSVHGGAWVGGDRFSNESFARHLAANGIVTLALEFRVPPAARYPECIADINAGIKWLKRHADEARTRPDLVGGIGFSSGGHQVMLSALRPADPRYNADGLSTVENAHLAFVVLVVAVLDPLGRYEMASRQGRQALVDGHDAYWPSTSDMDEGSPLGILERGEPVELPPVLAVQGDADANLGPDMATRFGTAYRARGGGAEVTIYPGEAHGFLQDPDGSPAARDASARIVAFINRQAQLVPAPARSVVASDHEA